MRTAGLDRFSVKALAENIMFDEFECNCIYVEISSDRVANAGRIEYRAKSCDICRAREALIRADRRAPVLFDSQTPRYQRTH